MAYRPSLRQTSKTRPQEALDPNMTPIMNLMVVLIPLLLSSVQLIKMSMIELNLPPAASSGAFTDNKEKEDPTSKLDLAVIITNEGFYLSSSSAVLKGKGKPGIPLKNGAYDYEGLAQQLYVIKEKVAGRFEDTESIVIQAEPEIDYQTLVSTMDAARSYRNMGTEVILFPKASLSALVL